MPTLAAIDPQHRVVWIRNDASDMSTIAAAYQALARRPDLPLRSRLIVMVSAAMGRRSTGEVREAVRLVSCLTARLGGPTALIASADAAFGNTRMLEIWASIEGCDVSVFHSEREARAWLGIGARPTADAWIDPSGADSLLAGCPDGMLPMPAGLTS